MKSKSVFIIVLFSLLLNIFHDSLLHQHSHTDDVVILMTDNSSHSHDTFYEHELLDDLHEAFHFSALLVFHEPLNSDILFSTKLSFTKKIYAQNILESSFKPPRT